MKYGGIITLGTIERASRYLLGGKIFSSSPEPEPTQEELHIAVQNVHKS